MSLMFMIVKMMMRIIFWVYIEGMMDDLTIDEQNQVIESYDGVFVEYWKFKRLGNRILLDEIRQQDEYEN